MYACMNVLLCVAFGIRSTIHTYMWVPFFTLSASLWSLYPPWLTIHVYIYYVFLVHEYHLFKARHMHISFFPSFSIGTGKTLLLDTFYKTAPTNRKTRVHFHEFLGLLYQSMHHWRYSTLYRGLQYMYFVYLLQSCNIYRNLYACTFGRRSVLFSIRGYWYQATVGVMFTNVIYFIGCLYVLRV